MKRREFLQKGALVVAGAAAVASGVAVVGYADEPATKKWKSLSTHEGQTIQKMARQIFPHDRLDDTYYVKVVDDLDSEASTTPATAKLLREGVARLDHSMDAKFVDLSGDDQIKAIKKVENTPFFDKVHSIELVSLYDNHEVWKRLAYPGASYKLGGYLHHGFNDLNWLPEPPESASPKPV
jgi:hypothetical protein